MHLQPHYFDELGLIYAAKEHGTDMFFVNSGTVQLQVRSASRLSMARGFKPGDLCPRVKMQKEGFFVTCSAIGLLCRV